MMPSMSNAGRDAIDDRAQRVLRAALMETRVECGLVRRACARARAHAGRCGHTMASTSATPRVANTLSPIGPSAHCSAGPARAEGTEKLLPRGAGQGRARAERGGGAVAHRARSTRGTGFRAFCR